MCRSEWHFSNTRYNGVTGHVQSPITIEHHCSSLFMLSWSVCRSPIPEFALRTHDSEKREEREHWSSEGGETWKRQQHIFIINCILYWKKPFFSCTGVKWLHIIVINPDCSEKKRHYSTLNEETKKKLIVFWEPCVCVSLWKDKDLCRGVFAKKHQFAFFIHEETPTW